MIINFSSCIFNKKTTLSIRHMAQQLLFEEKNKHVNHRRDPPEEENKRTTKSEQTQQKPNES